ncbi:hypothetical protein Tco_0025336 [Tanacetum coccineum]
MGNGMSCVRIGLSKVTNRSKRQEQHWALEVGRSLTDLDQQELELLRVTEEVPEDRKLKGCNISSNKFLTRMSGGHLVIAGFDLGSEWEEKTGKRPGERDDWDIGHGFSRLDDSTEVVLSNLWVGEV